MRKLTFLRAALCLAATIFMLSFTAGVTNAVAQACDPCPTWWVNYDYIFPPCVDPVTVEVQWENGQWSTVQETTDGHKTYNTPLPLSRAKVVKVNGTVVPIDGRAVWLTYRCNDGMQQCLKVEVRCNPCLEIKIHLEPCQECTVWWVDYNYIIPPCADPVNVDVQWGNGQWSNEVSNVDGHIIYNIPLPLSAPVAIKVEGINVPLNGPPVWVPYSCGNGLQNQCLKAEARINNNGCLEVKLHLEPCPPQP